MDITGHHPFKGAAFPGLRRWSRPRRWAPHRPWRRQHCFPQSPLRRIPGTSSRHCRLRFALWSPTAITRSAGWPSSRTLFGRLRGFSVVIAGGGHQEAGR